MKNNKYEIIDQVLNNIPENFSILEEEVDVRIQKEFFDMSEKLDFDVEDNQVSVIINEILNPETPENEQKIKLVMLSALDSVEAYRGLEKYRDQATNEDLKAWGILALQQSRMILESGLIGENQVFISTGLGGKNNKLRYFMVFPFTQVPLEITQQKLVESELKFFVEKFGGEAEQIEVHEQYATLTSLIPIKAPIPDFIEEFMEECNQFGQFLREDSIIITNVKKLTNTEIEEIFNDNDDEK
jgi:hypothetical protein